MVLTIHLNVELFSRKVAVCNTGAYETTDIQYFVGDIFKMLAVKILNLLNVSKSDQGIRSFLSKLACAPFCVLFISPNFQDIFLQFSV